MRSLRSCSIAFLIVLLFVSPTLSTETSQVDQSAAFAVEQLDLMPLAFTENYGRWDDRVQFRANVGANSNPNVVGENTMEHKCNYLIGNDPDELHYELVC